MLSFHSMHQRALNYFTLAQAAGPKKAAISQTWDTAKSVFDVNYPLPKGAGALLGRLDWDDDYLGKTAAGIQRAFSALDENDVVVCRGEPLYPEALAATADAPEVLFLRGKVELLNLPALAVVGARNASSNGIRRARKLGYLLAKRGVVVVSGLAKGIDQAAHRGALEAGGDTMAVLGTPLNRVYPAEHKSLQQLIGEAGLLVTQFTPSGKVQPYNFPLRNATMSGLSLGTIVVEASETSGALIQARKCLQQGRKLFIPQSAIDNPSLSWPKTYRDRGAIVFSEVDPVLAEAKELIANNSDLWVSQDPAHLSCSLKLTTSKP